MLRKFKISIDGTQYLVEMEEVGAPTPTPADAAPAPVPVAAPAPAPAPAPEPAPAPAAPAVAGSFAQTAPMPGTILDIHVKVGDTVAANQPVMVLEAMKMENEVVAEQAGTIASINVEKGTMVNPGDTLFTLA
ncbi:acetyl-CoA carboxylase biotin carboxyl carrier protein subunit [Collinsella stercoris]|uniref:acetyl-CoA carboxylase biotin carboxyl carrier protein subunit n=1 Tax=Collinsella stercoris TaxID=147206 RepID=UPI0023F13D38|nr:acetyl-CoA carboxylase biotin carboxyl carrier protein subunit [Collinsella stercoris]